jgi:hypothetical protein
MMCLLKVAVRAQPTASVKIRLSALTTNAAFGIAGFVSVERMTATNHAGRAFTVLSAILPVNVNRARMPAPPEHIVQPI